MSAKIFWVPGPWPGRLGIALRPRGGEWLGDEIRAWREAGIDVVVSLLEADEQADLDLTGEAASCRARGLDFRSFPIADRGVPRSCEAMADLAVKLLDALRSGQTVAVHCRQGIGRSAMVVAATLIAEGLDARAAVSITRQSRGLDVPETPAQRQWIGEFSAWRSSQAAAAAHRG
jgi:protein-tyrosine phosphatase